MTWAGAGWDKHHKGNSGWLHLRLGHLKTSGDKILVCRGFLTPLQISQSEEIWRHPTIWNWCWWRLSISADDRPRYKWILWICMVHMCMCISRPLNRMSNPKLPIFGTYVWRFPSWFCVHLDLTYPFRPISIHNTDWTCTWSRSVCIEDWTCNLGQNICIKQKRQQWLGQSRFSSIFSFLLLTYRTSWELEAWIIELWKPKKMEKCQGVILMNVCCQCAYARYECGGRYDVKNCLIVCFWGEPS